MKLKAKSHSLSRYFFCITWKRIKRTKDDSFVYIAEFLFFPSFLLLFLWPFSCRWRNWKSRKFNIPEPFLSEPVDSTPSQLSRSLHFRVLILGLVPVKPNIFWWLVATTVTPSPKKKKLIPSLYVRFPLSAFSSFIRWS